MGAFFRVVAACCLCMVSCSLGNDPTATSSADVPDAALSDASSGTGTGSSGVCNHNQCAAHGACDGVSP